MATVIQSSRGRVAVYHIPELILGGAFPALYLFAIAPADHLPNWLQAFWALAAFIGISYVILTLFKVYRILTAKGAWQITINDDRLIWKTATPNKTFPIDLALNDIEQTACIETITQGTDKDTWVTTIYEIRLKDGNVTAFTQEDSGVNPHRVFTKLTKRGIPYRLWKIDRSEKPFNKTRTLEKEY